MSCFIANTITGTYPNYSIDPGKVFISRGALAPAVNASAVASSGATVTFSWSDNSGTSAANQNDKALLAVVNPEKSEAVLDADGARRSDTTLSVNLPADWVGSTVHAYIGFVTEDSKEVANSVYLGSLTVA